MLKPGKYLSGKKRLSRFVAENQKTKNYETLSFQNRMCLRGSNQRESINMRQPKRSKKNDLHLRIKRRKVQIRCN